MKIADAFEEFVAYATLERCLETNTIYWYKRCVRPFIKYLRYNALESTLENLSVKTLRAYYIMPSQSSRNDTCIRRGSNWAFCTQEYRQCHAGNAVVLQLPGQAWPPPRK